MDFLAPAGQIERATRLEPAQGTIESRTTALDANLTGRGIFASLRNDSAEVLSRSLRPQKGAQSHLPGSRRIPKDRISSLRPFRGPTTHTFAPSLPRRSSGTDASSTVSLPARDIAPCT